jgi:uncharacterized protein YpmB
MTKKKQIAIAIAAITVIAIIISLAAYNKNETQEALCRHIVLSQYSAYKDAGYEVEIWHMDNADPKTAGFKYHVAIRVRKNENEEWLWVEQDKTLYRTTSEQPKDTKLRKQMTFDQVIKWVKK